MAKPKSSSKSRYTRYRFADIEAELRGAKLRLIRDLVINVLALIASVIGTLFSITGIFEFKPIYLIAALITGIFIGVLILFAVLLKRIKRGSEKVANLKGNLQSAFLVSLDNSSINPHRQVGESHVRFLRSE